MQIHNVKQGDQEWLNLRHNYYTASEASAICGDSKYQTRNELLTIKKTGVLPEINEHTQSRFDRGHKVEAMIRPVIEEIINDELYPVTGSIEIDGLPLLASFDGINLDETIVFECKLWNKSLVEAVENNDLPAHYYWQLEQQILVADAEKAIFVVTDGTKENMRYLEYYSTKERRKKLLANIKQFKSDLAEHEPAKAELKPEVKQIEQLPSLFVQLKGEVTDSNLEIYKSTALEFINSINTELSTDNDFAEAENVVKFCKKAESELSATKQAALAQTASIDELFKTVDFLSEELRQKRLYLDKLVKSKKTELKQGIVKEAEQKLGDHIRALEEEISPIKFPSILIGFNEAIRGKKTISSIQNAIDSELANIKINADEIASLIRKNLSYLESAADAYKFLFNDLQAIITKQQDDFKALVDIRVSNHKAEENKRIEVERERIRQEEERKIRAEQERIKLEEEQKAQAENQASIEKQEPTNKPESFVSDSPAPKATYTKGAVETGLSESEKIIKDIKNDIYLWFKTNGVEKSVAYNIVNKIDAGEVPHLSINYQ